MASDLLSNLNNGTASSFGKNLAFPPSRIVPLSNKEIEELPSDESKQFFNYITPGQEEEFVLCEPGSPLFEPAAYFQPTDTFLKSILYLTDVSFYKIAHLPEKRDMYLQTYLKKCLETFITKAPVKMVREAKKLMQHLMASQAGQYDTDPVTNPYFSILYKALLKRGLDNVIVIHSDTRGLFRSTTPEKLPCLQTNLNETEIKQRYLILLQLPNGTYSPYGFAFTSISETAK